MSEIKQATFRLNKEATERFKEYCEQNQLTAAQGFDYLMEVLALDNARSSLNTRETEISNFEQHAKALISAYLHSLELNENAEARIREQFSNQIESQARTISEYQEQINALEKQLEDALDFAESCKSELQATTDSLIAIEKSKDQSDKDFISLKEEKERQLADKNNIITMLSEKLTESEKKTTEYDTLKEQIIGLERDLSQALQTIKDNAKDAEIAQERAVRDAEKALEADHRKELERLRSQNTELLQTIAAIEKNSGEQIRAVEKENSSLREKLARLKQDLEEK